jgi:molybdopterin synthase sulfur carrier subunit
MQVNLYATFRLLAKAKTFRLDLPADTSIQDAIQAIVDAYPVLRKHWLNDAGELFPHVHAFLNGADAATLPDGLNTRLAAEDTLDFFPPVAGG